MNVSAAAVQFLSKPSQLEVVGQVEEGYDDSWEFTNLSELEMTGIVPLTEESKDKVQLLVPMYYKRAPPTDKSLKFTRKGEEQKCKYERLLVAWDPLCTGSNNMVVFPFGFGQCPTAWNKCYSLRDTTIISECDIYMLRPFCMLYHSG